MLFALVDWIKYEFQVGPYSPLSLAQLGAFRAMPELYASFAENTALGDHLFVHSTRSMVGWAIMYLTHGLWNHVGTVSAPGFVLEAIPERVGEYPFKKYFDGQNYLLILRGSVTPDRQERLRDRVNAEKGKRYAFRKVFRLLIMTLCNEHPDYRFRFTLDILISLSLLALVPSKAVRIGALVITSVYLTVLGVNSVIRLLAALRLYRDYQEYASPRSHLPINSSPNRLFRILTRTPGVGVLRRRDL